MGGIGGPELLIVLLVVLLVFGPRKIPEIARMMGKGMREFRRLSTEFQRELNIADALEGKSSSRPGHAAAPPPGSNPPPGAVPPPGGSRPSSGPAAVTPPGAGEPSGSPTTPRAPEGKRDPSAGDERPPAPPS